MAGMASSPAMPAARYRRAPVTISNCTARSVSATRSPGSGRTRIGCSTPLVLMLSASSCSLAGSKVLRGLVSDSVIWARGMKANSDMGGSVGFARGLAGRLVGGLALRCRHAPDACGAVASLQHAVVAGAALGALLRLGPQWQADVDRDLDGVAHLGEQLKELVPLAADGAGAFGQRDILVDHQGEAGQVNP